MEMSRERGVPGRARWMSVAEEGRGTGGERHDRAWLQGCDESRSQGAGPGLAAARDTVISHLRPEGIRKTEFGDRRGPEQDE